MGGQVHPRTTMDEDDAHRNHQPPRPLEGAPAPPARGSSIRYDPLADRISGKDAVVNDDVMVSKATGHVLQVASSDFFIDERGMLTSRALSDGDMNSNVTIDGARRRLLSEDASPAAVVTAPMTDGEGVLSASDGSPVQTEQAAYSGTLDDDFGVEDLFDLSMAELKSITHWEFEDEFEGRVVDLVIVGAEYARKVIIDEKDTTPTEGAAVFGEADEDYSGEVTVVQQIKLLSSHYQYSMMVVHKFEWMTPDLETTVDMDVLEPLIIEKGAEDMATISWIVDEMTAEGAEIEEEDEENQEATRRHLMGRCRPSWGRRCKMKRKKEELLKLRIRVALLWRKKAMESPLAAFKKTGQITKPKTRAIDAGKKVFNKVKNGLMTAVNWLKDLAPKLLSIPTKVVKFVLQNVDFLPAVKIVDGISNGFSDMLSLLFPDGGLCLPTWLFLGKMPHGSKARDFLNEETVNFYKDPSLGSVDTQISEFKPCFGITNFVMDSEKMVKFFKDLFIFLVGPLWETVSTAMIDAFIAPMGEIEKLLGRTQTAVQTARDDHAKSKNLRRLMASRRRLMGMGQFSALEAEDFTGEEMDQLLDDIVAHAVTTAAVRNGADVRDDGNSGRRRQLMEGVESDDGVLGDVHRVIESMFEWTHNSVIAGAYERMPALLSQPPPSARRGLLEGGGPNGESMGLGAGGLDWSNLMAFKEFEIVESVSFEETFRLIFTKNHTSVIAGDLLDMTGISKEITLPMKIASYESSPSPGVTIGFDMVMDIALPVTLVAEGACELLVKVSMKNMTINADLVSGKIIITGANSEASGMVLNAHTRVGGMVEMRASARLVLNVCAYGACTGLSAEGTVRMQAGFDAVYGYAVDPAVRVTYLDETHGNFMGRSLLQPNAFYHKDKFQCIGADTPAFAAGGVFIHIPSPHVGLRLKFPMIPRDAPGGAGEMMQHLPPELMGGWLFEYPKDPNLVIFSEPIYHFCEDDPSAPPVDQLENLLQEELQNLGDLGDVLNAKLAEKGMSVEQGNNYDINDFKHVGG